MYLLQSEVNVPQELISPPFINIYAFLFSLKLNVFSMVTVLFSDNAAISINSSRVPHMLSKSIPCEAAKSFIIFSILILKLPFPDISTVPER